MGKLNLLDYETAIGFAIFWEDESSSYSYASIKKMALAQSAFTSAEKGSICALCGFSPLESWILMLAAWSAGLSVLPFAEKATQASIDLALEQLPWALKLERSAGEWKRSGNDRDSIEIPLIVSHSSRAASARDNPSDVFIMTSGSTGVPKAIAHSLEGLSVSARATLRFYNWQAGDSWLLSLDPSHIGGLQILLRVWLGRGLCYYGGEPKAVADAALRRPCDYLSLVPTQLFRLLERPEAAKVLRRAKAILLGGAATQSSLLEQFRSLALPVSITYGSSETASQISAFKAGELPDRQENVGEVLDIWQLVSDGEHDLWIDGPALMQGYWQKQIWHSVSGPYLLSDRGQLIDRTLLLDGRRDQVFQVGGENLAPGEILSLIESIHPQTDLQILAKNDEVLGHKPWLIIRSRRRPALEPLLNAFTALPLIKRPREIWWFVSDDVSKLSKTYIEQLLASGDDHMQRLWTYEKI